MYVFTKDGFFFICKYFFLPDLFIFICFISDITFIHGLSVDHIISMNMSINVCNYLLMNLN